MKKYIFPALVLALLLSACGSPAAEGTPTPEPTPTETATPLPWTTWWVSTPEPEPDPTPALSYEDYFAQEIDYGSMFDEEEHEYGHFTHIRENDIALAQKLIPDDTIGLIPETMNWVIDGCYSVFWAGNEKGAYLYRLYIPTEILDLIYTIPAEEFEEKYFYTPQTEDTAYFFRSSEYHGPIGQKICLLKGVTPRSNYLYEWSCYNPEFLTKYDEMASHKEDYPQFDWEGVSDYDMVSLIESNNWERWEEPFLFIGRCINAATGEYRERQIDTYSPDRYEIQW